MRILNEPSLRKQIHAVILVVVSAAIVALSLAVSAHAATDADAILGRWRFTAALDAADIASLDEHEAAALIGKVFTISRQRVTFGSRDCGAPELQVERVEPDEYLREQAHASGENLRLPNPVTVVDLGCTIAFIKGKNRLVIFWKGWFFDATRLK